MKKQLSKRAQEAVDLMAQDKCAKEVAAIMGIGWDGVNNYLRKARHIYGCKTTHGLLLKIERERHNNGSKG